MATKKKKKQISINEKTIRLLSSAVLAIILWLFINGNSLRITVIIMLTCVCRGQTGVSRRSIPMRSPQKWI